MGVFDYMKQQSAARRDYAAEFDSKTKPIVNDTKAKMSSPFLRRKATEGAMTEEDKQAHYQYKQATEAAQQGMTENAPETADERARREKRERNMQIINGVGTAISGVAGMIGGFTGGYAFPDDEKREDPVNSHIEKGKAERLARAQRYYSFSQAKNKALDDYLKYKKDKADQKLKEDLTRAQTNYYNERARGEGIKADDQKALDDAEIKKRNRAGSSGGSDDPGSYKSITSPDRSRKYIFKRQDQYNNALNQAFRFVPHVSPYYEEDNLGQLKPTGTPAQLAAQYAASNDSNDNTAFWNAIKNASETTSPAGKADSPFNRKKKPSEPDEDEVEF